MVKLVKVDIEYCPSSSSEFKNLGKKIRKEVPGAIVNGTEGRLSSFEVKLNDWLIYSKLESGEYPKKNEIVQEVKKFASNREASDDEGSKSKCGFM